ncbi:MAG: hypothetical protein KA521_10030 [Crocinitomicaceae bacterium]|nr:hypothetical protein [Crocinitomicaceae bacterium]
MRYLSLYCVVFLVFLFGNSSTVFGQKNQLIQVYAHPNQVGGFERIIPEKNALNLPQIYRKSTVLNSVDFVSLSFRKNRKFTLDSLDFLLNNQAIRLKIRQKNDTLYSLELPKRTLNYELKIVLNNEVKALLKVAVYKELTKHVYLVPLIPFSQSLDSLQDALNQTFSAAGVKLVLHKETYVQLVDNQQELLDNPSPDFERYTIQMQAIRDAYLAKKGKLNSMAYFVFIVPGFVNDSIRYYAVENRSIGFLSVNETHIKTSLQQLLAIGFGAGKSHSINESFSYLEWKKVRQHIHTFSMYDPYEHIRSSNGRVAYYFWKQNKDGFIRMNNKDILSSIVRPYKKNYFSYHLHITTVWFKPLFFIKNYSFNLVHILSTLLVFVSAIYYRIKLHRFIKLRFRRSFILRVLSRFTIFLVAIGVSVLLYILVNFGYRFFEIEDGIIPTLKGKSSQKVMAEIGESSHNPRMDVYKIHSEVMMKEGKQWKLHRLKRVLYFNVELNSTKQASNLFFAGSSDSLLLPTASIAKKAENHYIVLQYKRDSELIQQKVYNYSGVELTAKLKLKDPVSRVLLFVNGYRPTVFGADFEQTFAAIQQKGLEFPNSENVLFDFDRFDYWQPWNNIVGLFQKRINPATILYADGHFSVSTSNYKNMVEFTSVSSRYPKRCSNPKKHHCYKTITTRSKFFGGTKKENTLDLLPLKANKKGFELRYQNGKTAGLNLLQRLNEIPNRSQNDTLFIVAHSMGYAYSLGIIDVVRGHINFGGFYIIAPENASSGKLKTNEWKEVWQYGSKLWGKAEAPCMQDGVAPQQLAQGLKANHHVEFPVSSYRHRGFFNSHFIGYYTWIFDLQSKEKGFIGQH